STQVDKGNFDEIEHVITIPSTAAFAAVSSAIEFRIVAFGAQFDEHNTSITAFKLTQTVSGPQPSTPSNFHATANASSQVVVAWDGVSGATQYEVTRRFNGGSESIIATPSAPGFTDVSAAP